MGIECAGEAEGIRSSYRYVFCCSAAKVALRKTMANQSIFIEKAAKNGEMILLGCRCKPENKRLVKESQR